MKSNQRKTPEPRDTPATRKRRLQQRLQELSDKSEQELAALMKSVEKVKSAFRNDKNKPTPL
jgi:predicted house-cleaning noncanonical NTP pyrophosphatase (MazG superfamily)